MFVTKKKRSIHLITGINLWSDYNIPGTYFSTKKPQIHVSEVLTFWFHHCLQFKVSLLSKRNYLVLIFLNVLLVTICCIEFKYWRCVSLRNDKFWLWMVCFDLELLGDIRQWGRAPAPVGVPLYSLYWPGHSPVVSLQWGIVGRQHLTVIQHLHYSGPFNVSWCTILGRFFGI